jgi:hypothetical protein
MPQKAGGCSGWIQIKLESSDLVIVFSLLVKEYDNQDQC